MNTHKQSKARTSAVFAAGAAVLLAGGLASTLHSAEPATDAQTTPNTVAMPVVAPDTNQVAVKIQLTGAELYSMHCNRCHPERYPTERTAAQWKTIMLHMQVRANIPVQQSKLILQYLQENSGR
jgi:cytochrome c5